MAQLTREQAAIDFQTLSAAFQNLYGPMAFKEAKYNFKYEDLVRETSAQLAVANGDVDIYAALSSFLAHFHDGHVHIGFPANATGVKAYSLGFKITPLEGRAIVSGVKPDEPGLKQIAVGDELLTIDGSKPFDLLPYVLKYNTVSTDATNQHLIAALLRRPSYMKELIPKSPNAVLVFAHPNGEQVTITEPWTQDPLFDTKNAHLPDKNSVTNLLARGFYELLGRPYATIDQIGQPMPVFATPTVMAAYHWAPVKVNQTYLDKYKLKEPPAIAAFTYAYGGRTIMLVRQPSYDVPSEEAGAQLISGYEALLDQMQGNVDVLIIDQTHNPGGSLDYATAFFRLFVQQPANNGVEFVHVDRKWVADIGQSMVQMAAVMNSAPSANDGLADPTLPAQLALFQNLYQTVDGLSSKGAAGLTPTPYPLSGLEKVEPSTKFTWKKPILVMANELSGSCGDFFPMMMQRNGVAKIFGATTMGLGGNVDDNAVTLPYSQASVDITRGLYTTYRADGAYSFADYVENAGIAPDYPVAHTVEDFRAGFVGYVKAFSDAALEQIPVGTPVAPPPPPTDPANAGAPKQPDAGTTNH